MYYINKDNDNLLDKFNLIDTLTKYLVMLFYIVCVRVIHMFMDVYHQREREKCNLHLTICLFQ